LQRRVTIFQALTDHSLTDHPSYTQAIKSNLAPAFFSLASRIYGNSIATGPTVGDRSSYANDVIESWTRCIAVLVSNGLDVSSLSLPDFLAASQALSQPSTKQTWSSYLRYGDYSFQRIGDALGKLDTSLFLAVHILELDDGVYSVRLVDALSSQSPSLTRLHYLYVVLHGGDSYDLVYDDCLVQTHLSTHPHRDPTHPRFAFTPFRERSILSNSDCSINQG
jgi:hypothetical protein